MLPYWALILSAPHLTHRHWDLILLRTWFAYRYWALIPFHTCPANGFGAVNPLNAFCNTYGIQHHYECVLPPRILQIYSTPLTLFGDPHINTACPSHEYEPVPLINIDMLLSWIRTCPFHEYWYAPLMNTDPSLSWIWTRPSHETRFPPPVALLFDYMPTHPHH